MLSCKGKLLFILICLFTLAGCATTTSSDSTNPDNFIPAANLSNAEIDELWAYTIDKCYEQGYSVTFNDRKSKNIACQMETEGEKSTYTVRVKFSDSGIFIDTTSNSMANLVFGSIGTKHSTRLMKSALEEKVSEMRGGR